MGFLWCCKDCSCWCIFTISTVILLVSTGLAISDMAYMAETKEAIDIVLNSPAPQLRCLEVCRTWFSEESGQSCCDRYNSNLCLEKAVCKEDFLSASEVDLQVIRNDAQSQLMTAVLCLITMIVIAFLQFKMYQLEKKMQTDILDNIQVLLGETLQNRKLLEQQTLKDRICQLCHHQKSQQNFCHASMNLNSSGQSGQESENRVEKNEKNEDWPKKKRQKTDKSYQQQTELILPTQIKPPSRKKKTNFQLRQDIKID